MVGVPNSQLSSFSFSRDGRLFGAVTLTKGVCVWDTVSSGVVFKTTTRDNVAALAVAISSCTTTGSNKKRKGDDGGQEGESGPGGDGERLVGIASSNGSVSLYSLSAPASNPASTPASAAKTPLVALSLSSTAAATDKAVALAFANHAALVAIASQSGHVALFSTANYSRIASINLANVHSVSSIAFSNADDQLVAAGTTAVLLNVNPLSAVKTFTGHATQVASTAFTASSPSLLLTQAAHDRFVSVWNTSKDAPSSNLVALTLDSAPTSIAVSTATASQSSHVLAVTEEGSLAFWHSLEDALESSSSSSNSDTTSAARKKKKASAVPTVSPAATLSVRVVALDTSSTSSAAPKVDTTKPSKTAPVLAAQFSHASATEVLYAYGSVLRPCFERVSLLKRDHATLIVEEDFDDLDALFVKGSIQVVRAEKGGVYVGVGDVQKGQAMSATKKYSEKASAKVVQSTSTFSMNLPAASSAPALPATANSEPTLQDRLQTLAIASAAPAPTRPTTGRRLANPTATTLHNLLAQAVASRDAALLEQCLNVSDSAVVAATVRRLPAGEVAPLLDLLTARMQMRPARVERLVEWVRAVVVCHAAFLMTNPHLVANLGALHATLAERTATFEKMLKLGGRLDLVSSQIGLRAQRARFEDEDAEEKNGNGSGVAVYDEADEEDEDGMQEDGGDEFDDGDESDGELDLDLDEDDFYDDVEEDEAFDEDDDLDGEDDADLDA